MRKALTSAGLAVALVMLGASLASAGPESRNINHGGNTPAALAATGPLPSSMVFFGTGLIGIGAYVARKKIQLRKS